ncbi:MAG: flagellar hook-length control protein FliK [Lachnospiraceae bacterium]|nr:flagellar hook-length control protein FliK [Lachnospiraceae bacterium]
MVGAGILNASFAEMKTDTGSYSNTKSSSVQDDFTKILDAQGKNYKTTEKKDDIRSDSNGSVNEKKEMFQKLFRKDAVNQTDELPEEEAVACVMVKAEVVMEQIVEELSGQFDLEAIQDCMNQLGMTEADLFDKQNVTKLVMELMGISDMSELLVDNSLSETIKNLYAEIETISEDMMNELGMSQTEFEKLLEKVDAAIEAMHGEDELVNQEFMVTEELDDSELKAGQTDDTVTITVESASADDSETVIKTSSEEAANGEHDTEDGQGQQENILGSGILDSLNNAVNSSAAAQESGITERIMAKILDEIKVSVGPETTSLEIQLEPESLGKVSIEVSSKSGILTAHIAAENEIAKETIESQLSTLKETLESQGLKVDEIEVMVASKGFEQSFEKEQNGSGKENQTRTKKHISQEELDEINGISQVQEETLVEEVMKDMGNTVSYTA